MTRARFAFKLHSSALTVVHLPLTIDGLVTRLLRMHHVLEIQEILSNIFSHYDPYPWTAAGRNDLRLLAALARTCRAFKEPALDMLWQNLHDLSPLARCLPEASHKRRRGNLVRWFQVIVTLVQY